MGTRTQEFRIDLSTEPVPRAGRLVTSVRRENGAVRYFENGIERPFVTYRSPSAGTWRGGRHQFLSGFDRAGVRLAEISIPLGPRYWREDGSLDEAGLEREMLSAFHCTSNMNLICSFNVDAPGWYVKAHAEDRFAFADGVRPRGDRPHQGIGGDVRQRESEGSCADALGLPCARPEGRRPPDLDGG